MNANLVKLLEPGTTPVDDGVATVKVMPSTGSAIVHIAADSMAVRGLDIDGTLPTGFPGTTYGIYVSGSYGMTSYNAVLTWRAPSFNIAASIRHTLRRRSKHQGTCGGGGGC
ncbi:MAG: hypothetical protein ACHQ50_15545, partial [Fimbriimonadales bacterium]